MLQKEFSGQSHVDPMVLHNGQDQHFLRYTPYLFTALLYATTMWLLLVEYCLTL